MRKYLAIIDYKAFTGKMFDYVEITARVIATAQKQAQALYGDDVYLVKIAEKVREKKEKSVLTADYKEIYEYRGLKWDHYIDEEIIIKGNYKKDTGAFFEYALVH